MIALAQHISESSGWPWWVMGAGALGVGGEIRGSCLQRRRLLAFILLPPAMKQGLGNFF